MENYIKKKEDKPFMITSFLNIFDKMAPETVFFAGEYSRLPIFFYYIGGFFWNGGWVCLFLYFLYISYQSASTSSFVSLQSDNGICDEVPFSVTGAYKFDNYGYWESQEEYNPSFSSMVGEFKAFAATNQNYSRILTIAANKFEKISKKSMYRDLAYNLNVLASAYNISTTSGKLEIQPTGYIGYMLDQKNSIIGAIYNTSDLNTDEKPGCFGVDAVVMVDVGSNTLSSSFSYNESSNNCKLMATSLGYDIKYGDTFRYRIDLGSFSTAIAVNNFILSVKDLKKIARTPFSYAPDDDLNLDDAVILRKKRRVLNAAENVKLEKMKLELNRERYNIEFNLEAKIMKAMSDRNIKHNNEREYAKSSPEIILTGVKFVYATKYTGMRPIYCFIFNNDEDQALCFLYDLSSENNFISQYPIMKHYLGTNCTDDSVWGTDWYDHIPEILQNSSKWMDQYDHTFDIILGLLVIPDIAHAVDFALQTYANLTSSFDGDLIVSNKYYPAMKRIVDTVLIGADLWEPELVDLCGLTSSGDPINCFLVAINQYGVDRYVNADHYQLFAGACRNSLYYKDAFTKAAKDPPTKLIQTYYSCKPTIYDAIFSSIGLSLGNAEVYMIIGWCAFSFLLTICLWFFAGFDPKMHIYPQDDDDDDDDEDKRDRGGSTKDEQKMSSSYDYENIYSQTDNNSRKNSTKLSPFSTIRKKSSLGKRLKSSQKNREDIL